MTFMNSFCEVTALSGRLPVRDNYAAGNFSLPHPSLFKVIFAHMEVIMQCPLCLVDFI
jgi:hypothetical protein